MSPARKQSKAVNMERKALERLVDALLDAEFDESRHEAIARALMQALVALEGHEFTEEDADELESNLERLAVQILVNQLRNNGATLYRTKADAIEDGKSPVTVEVVATTDPIVLALINKGVEHMLSASEDDNPFDVN